MKKIISLVLLFCLMFALSSCEGKKIEIPNPNIDLETIIIDNILSKTYKIKLNVLETEMVITLKPDEEFDLSKHIPTVENYTFKGWYYDEVFLNQCTLTNFKNVNATLYGKYEKNDVDEVLENFETNEEKRTFFESENYCKQNIVLNKDEMLKFVWNENEETQICYILDDVYYIQNNFKTGTNYFVASPNTMKFYSFDKDLKLLNEEILQEQTLNQYKSLKTYSFAILQYNSLHKDEINLFAHLENGEIENFKKGVYKYKVYFGNYTTKDKKQEELTEIYGCVDFKNRTSYCADTSLTFSSSTMVLSNSLCPIWVLHLQNSIFN